MLWGHSPFTHWFGVEWTNFFNFRSHLKCLQDKKKFLCLSFISQGSKSWHWQQKPTLFHNDFSALWVILRVKTQNLASRFKVTRSIGIFSLCKSDKENMVGVVVATFAFQQSSMGSIQDSGTWQGGLMLLIWYYQSSQRASYFQNRFSLSSKFNTCCNTQF